MSHWLQSGIAGFVLLGGVSGAMAQGGQVDLTVDAGPSLGSLAERVRRIDRPQLAASLARAGLNVPPQVRVTLIPEDDARARATPRWIVGVAFDSRDVAIFPARVGPYPYDSIESVVSHEVVHLALAAQAGGPLPRWFHEGVATSVEQGWSVTSQARLLLATVGNPGLANLGRLFASGSEPETVRAYLLAAALVSDIRERPWSHPRQEPLSIASRVARPSRVLSCNRPVRRRTRLQRVRGDPTAAGRVGFQSRPAVRRSGWASWGWRSSPSWPPCASARGAGGSGTNGTRTRDACPVLCRRTGTARLGSPGGDPRAPGFGVVA